MSFQDAIDRFSPWWLRGRVAGTLLQAVGATLDSATETLVRGFYAGNPLRCEPDALDDIGVDRRIRRYPTEPEASYRLRLARWRQSWKLAGGHRGEMLQLQPYFLPGGLPRIRTVHQAGDGSCATWHTLEPDGTYFVHRATPSNWNWDGVPLKWSRFWVIVYTSGIGALDTIRYDEGSNYDEGHLWDGSVTRSQVDDMVSIINDFKAAHSTLWGLILARDPNSFDPEGSGTDYPDGTWGYYINHTTGQPTRLDTASYSYDLGQG